MLAEDAIKSAVSSYYEKNPTNLAGTAASMPKIEVDVKETGGEQAAKA